jgi:GNAT superfamily N-acetyltransferase
MSTGAGSAPAAAVGPRSLTDLRGLGSLGLSETFDGLLPLFAREVRDAGGEVLAGGPNGRIDAVLLYDGPAHLGSIFGTGPDPVEELARARAPAEYFTEYPIGIVRDTLDVLRVDLEGWSPPGTIRHAIRIAGPDDLAELARVSRSLSGPHEERWARALWDNGETCFVAEVDGRIAGVCWAARAGRLGRVHSLVVHPRYRRIGIGSDLLVARLLWLRACGARRVLSEVARRNTSSRRIAERAGMRRAGQMFLVYRR